MSSHSLSWWFLFSKSKGTEKAGSDNKTVLRIMKLELIKQEASYLYKPGLGPEDKSRSPEDKSNGHGWTVLSQGLCGEGKLSYESIRLAKDCACIGPHSAVTFCPVFARSSAREFPDSITYPVDTAYRTSRQCAVHWPCKHAPWAPM